MLKKNQIHTAEITGYTSDGAGVCRIDGRAVFVKGTIVGETWEVRILKVTSSVVYGKGRALSLPFPYAANTSLPGLSQMRRLLAAAYDVCRRTEYEALACE